jgi:hypothetical protein
MTHTTQTNDPYSQLGYTSYVAINSYRSSTSHGFGNTWDIRRCTPADRRKALRDGLPVGDCWLSDGIPIRSTMGVRPATAAERRRVRKSAAPYDPAVILEA